ncbi:MAG: TIGR03905 family TSCPD domain-containing protein [Oscillospiraceae bacterium]|nr:TIGR03905 family TSCPD domain-containing protein [Oscillospiraceae bacterium]
MKTVYEAKGTCSQFIEIETDDGVIKNVRFAGGCPGNLLAIGELVKNMTVDDAIKRLDGIKCGDKRTSCGDQLAQALKTV